VGAVQAVVPFIAPALLCVPPGLFLSLSFFAFVLVTVKGEVLEPDELVEFPVVAVVPVAAWFWVPEIPWLASWSVSYSRVQNLSSFPSRSTNSTMNLLSGMPFETIVIADTLSSSKTIPA
jgi:hypothetical protein